MAGIDAGKAVATGVGWMIESIATVADAIDAVNRGFGVAQEYATRAFAAIAAGAANASYAVDTARTFLSAIANVIVYIGDIALMAGTAIAGAFSYVGNAAAMLGEGLAKVGSIVGAAFGVAARAVGSFADWLIGKAIAVVDAMGKMYSSVVGDTQKSDLTRSLEAVKQGLNETARAQSESLTRISAQTSSGEKVRAAFAEIKNGAAAATAAIDPATASMKRMGDATFEVAGKIGDLVDKLKEERDTFGLASTSAELYKLTKEGATAATIAQAQSIVDEIDAMKAAAENDTRMVDQAAAIIDATRTPIETLRSELDKIAKLTEAGYLTEDQGKRGAFKATESFRQSQGNPRSAAMEFGSAQARSAVLAFQDRSRDPFAADEPGKATAKNTAKAVEVQTATLGVLQTIARSMSAPTAAEVF